MSRNSSKAFPNEFDFDTDKYYSYIKIIARYENLINNASKFVQ